MMQVKLTENHLSQFLKEKKLNPEIEPQSKQMFITLKIKGMEILVFLGIRGEGTLLQTIAYIPYQLQKQALGDVARLLHVLNREVDVPGFGMDEKQKLIFFRCVIPCLGGLLETKLLELFLATSRMAVETFMEAITVLASGKTDVTDKK